MIAIYETAVPDEAREELQAMFEGLERDGITDATVSMKDGHLHVEAVKVLPAKLDRVEVTVGFAPPEIPADLRTVKARRLIESTLEQWATIGGEPIWAVVDSSCPEGFAIVGEVEPGQQVIASVTNFEGPIVVEWTDPAMKPPPLPDPVQMTCTGCSGLKIVRVTDPGEVRPRPIFCKSCNGTGLEWVRPEEGEG